MGGMKAALLAVLTDGK
jgi:hypothetical protein